MKKIAIIFSFAAGLLFLAGNLSAQSNSYPSNGALEGQAKAAYQQNCGSYNGALNASVNVVSACFAGGFITEVTLAPKLNCNQVDCANIRVAPVARVTFGCDGDVIQVECLGQ